MFSRISIDRIGRPLRSAIVALLFGVVIVFQILSLEPLTALRHAFFDFAQRVVPPPRLTVPVTIVDIDEASIAAFGQWPWPRDRIAELVTMIGRGGPAVIGIDLLFPEPDRLSPENLLSGYELSPFVRDQLAKLPTNDQALAASLRIAPTVLATAAAARRPESGRPAVARTPVDLKLDWRATPTLKRYEGLLASLPELEAASAGSGIATVEIDRDGVIRRLPTLVAVGDALVPGFAVEVARLYFGAAAVGVEIDGGGISALTIGPKSFATDIGGNIWLRDVTLRHANRLSASEILYDRFDADDVEGRVVLVGATGTGLAESFVSSRGTALSALDTQALFVANLLGEVHLHRSHLSVLLEVAATLIGCIGIVLLRQRLRAYGGQAAVLLYAGLLVVASLALFDTQRLLLDPSATLLAMLIVYLLFIGVEIVATQRERRRTDEARRTALVLAESASHAKTNFLAGMSHELRTPLNAIIGFSEMIKDGMLGPISPPTYQNYAKDIHNSAVHLLGIVTQILDMANLESGETRLRISAFDFKEVLDESIATIRRARADNNPDIAVASQSVFPALRADRRMVNQMLLNLLLNAVKFSPAGGPIQISCFDAANGDFCVSVRDSGDGMSQKQVAEAFEIFQGSDQMLSDSTRGIGLGLPITTAMIEEHGGRIDVASQKGRGTLMTLTFPANRIVRA